jgi:hypothetical protein
MCLRRLQSIGLDGRSAFAGVKESIAFTTMSCRMRVAGINQNGSRHKYFERYYCFFIETPLAGC